MNSKLKRRTNEREKNFATREKKKRGKSIGQERVTWYEKEERMSKEGKGIKRREMGPLQLQHK